MACVLSVMTGGDLMESLNDGLFYIYCATFYIKRIYAENTEGCPLGGRFGNDGCRCRKITGKVPLSTARAVKWAVLEIVE